MPQLRRRTTLLAAVALLAGLVAAAPASASRKATARQAAALTKAVVGSPVAGLRQVPRSHYRVAKPRISTVSPSWATASFVAQPRYVDTFQSGYVLAVRLAGTRRWVVVDAGSSEVGCGIAPNGVIADLLGIKQPANACPHGEGVS